MPCTIPVSYTHLDVYKRQHTHTHTHTHTPFLQALYAHAVQIPKHLSLFCSTEMLSFTIIKYNLNMKSFNSVDTYFLQFHNTQPRFMEGRMTMVKAMTDVAFTMVRSTFSFPSV